MEKFLQLQTVQDISMALLICCALLLAYFWFLAWLKREDERWRESDAPRYEVQPNNLDQIMAIHGVTQAERAKLAAQRVRETNTDMQVRRIRK